MKRKFIIFSLLFSLSASPAQAMAQSSMPMVEMFRAMLAMMEMFRWMTGGGSGWNNNPYAYGNNFGGFNPYSTGTSALGWGSNPMLFSGAGNPFSSMGSYPASMGSFPFNSLYPGSIPYQGMGTTPGFSQWPGLSGYQGTPYNRWPGGGYSNPWYNTGRSYDQAWRNAYSDYPPPPRTAAPLVVQPVIVQPAVQGSGETARNGTSARKPAPVHRNPAPRPAARKPKWSANNMVRGQWLGINGEYLEFDGQNFQLIDNDNYLSGRYQLKNGILKADLDDADTPVYMQYQLKHEHLMFRAENDQLMLFRRVRR